MRSSSEPYATLAAQTVQKKHRSTWGLAETGATGPTGNRYGDPAGHSCIAIAGPKPRVITLRTGSDDRVANMRAFAKRALEELAAALEVVEPSFLRRRRVDRHPGAASARRAGAGLGRDPCTSQ